MMLSLLLGVVYSAGRQTPGCDCRNPSAHQGTVKQQAVREVGESATMRTTYRRLVFGCAGEAVDNNNGN